MINEILSVNEDKAIGMAQAFADDPFPFPNANLLTLVAKLYNALDDVLYALLPILDGMEPDDLSNMADWLRRNNSPEDYKKVGLTLHRLHHFLTEELPTYAVPQPTDDENKPDNKTLAQKLLEQARARRVAATSPALGAANTYMVYGGLGDVLARGLDEKQATTFSAHYTGYSKVVSVKDALERGWPL